MGRSADSVDRDVSRLLGTVVEGGFCIGCGVCAVARPDQITMALDGLGRYQAERISVVTAGVKSTGLDEHGSTQTGQDLSVVGVCPFGDSAANEDEIANSALVPAAYSPALGKYLSVIAGYVTDRALRSEGSSGGLVTWLLTQLLDSGVVDGVLHVVPTSVDGSGVLFRYDISRTSEEVRRGAKSKYYPVELSRVLRIVRDTPGRYALVGLPCFIKATRLLAQRDVTIRERLVYYIGLICGHLKTAQFADLLAWQCGIPPGRLSDIDFRVKLDEPPASQYAISVRGLDSMGNSVSTVRPMRGLVGADWGLGLLKYSACEFCDDVFAETADIAIGDAWLPQYTRDPRGTNMAVIRHKELLQVLERGLEEGKVVYEALTPEEAAHAQAGALRHRREGLSYRLQVLEREGKWYPRKRVRAGEYKLTLQRQRIYQLRFEIAQAGGRAFANAVRHGSLALFTRQMTPLVRAYERAYRPLARRVLHRIRSLAARVTRRRKR